MGVAGWIGTAGAVILAAVALGRPAHAQGDPEAPEVTLSARAGPLSVTGRVVGYDGDVYALDTVYGLMTFNAAGMDCAGAGCPDEPAIAIEGDGALAGVLMPALIEAYAARRGLGLTWEAVDPGHDAYRLEDGEERLRIDLRRIGSEAGLAALSAGRADAALSVSAEATAVGAIPGEGGQRVLALDALVPVVSPRNPVRALSPDGLASLLSGGAADWEGVGGPPGAVTLHLPEGGAGAAEAARELAAHASGPGTRTVRRDDPGSLSAAVARDPRALGLASAGTLGLAEPLAMAGPCGLVSRFEPDAVRTGDWPLTLPMRLHLPARPLPRLAREFVAFATSAEAQGVVRRAGLVDQAPRGIPVGAQGDRLAAAILRAGEEVPLDTLRTMTAQLNGMTRLTPTFRFERGVLLDAPSREAVVRLARRIADGAHDGRELVLVGFGDGTGSAERNLVVSRRRADAVLEAVLARAGGARADGPTLSAVGYGEVLPVACDDTASGRRLNRRVELWTR